MDNGQLWTTDNGGQLTLLDNGQWWKNNNGG